ncbi:uncharacterized protein SOCE26_056820 [Sorangium cellulosum]|uniref:Uncharacterized protein n=1 Tax=Sorangium cellulosum TaxID=56 RepID=A0A2L0EY38_SORCE|nr:hypothetical protein [Sorangium cellulosum]AUX44218.1 uncharacterized protein SOCE26_056820 [Sorangium cellulosum]
MGRDDKERRDEPLAQGKGRVDEVDQSKGIFRLDGPHPKDAELRAPGTIGGGPYEESGRGGPAGSLEPRDPGAGAVAAAGASPEEQPEASGGPPEDVRPAGALPQHVERSAGERTPAGG